MKLAGRAVLTAEGRRNLPLVIDSLSVSAALHVRQGLRRAVKTREPDEPAIARDAQTEAEGLVGVRY